MEKVSNDNSFQFPPSVQSDFFWYLKPEQQEQLRPILRVLKPWAQAELCNALIDYLETGIADAPCTTALACVRKYIINDTNINLKPLHV